MTQRASLQARFYLAASLILAVGLASAFAIYVTAEDEPENLAIREMVGSKPYVRQLQRFGGKAAVLYDEFSRWFDSLWRGKSVGVTIAWISVGASFGVFLVSWCLGPNSIVGASENETPLLRDRNPKTRL